MTTKLSENEIQASLEAVPEWSEASGKIQRTFEFKDFSGAMRFVNVVADEAETRRHHPDILIRYNRVMLTLSTHDAGGITEKDFALASFADDAYAA